MLNCAMATYKLYKLMCVNYITHRTGFSPTLQFERRRFSRLKKLNSEFSEVRFSVGWKLKMRVRLR